MIDKSFVICYNGYEIGIEVGDVAPFNEQLSEVNGVHFWISEDDVVIHEDMFALNNEVYIPDED